MYSHRVAKMSSSRTVITCSSKVVKMSSHRQVIVCKSRVAKNCNQIIQIIARVRIVTNHMNETGEMDVIEKYRQLLKDNMEYELLKEKLSIGEGDYLDEMLELMVETICIHCDSVRIGSKDIPYQLVKARLLKINAMHIEYVIDCLQKATNKIHNIKAYLLTMLYNAPTTINSYYRTEVNYDMQNGFAMQDEFAV